MTPSRPPSRFSLVIPCYNEAANLPLLLDRCARLATCPDVDVILVDNGSTDATPDTLATLLPRHPNCRSIRVPVNRGYGHGILEGLRVVETDLLGWTHADLQTDPLDVLAGLDLFDEHGSDILVKGKRHGRPIADRIFTAGMSLFETVLLGHLMQDINAQPTMCSRSFFETWAHPPNDFSLDLFAYYMAAHRGLAVRRFPVRFGERAHGTSHWNVNFAQKRKFIWRTLDYSVKLKRELAAPSAP